MRLWVDSRMISCSGIGTVLKNLIPFLPFASTTLIVPPNALNEEAWLGDYSLKTCAAPIYSFHEQFSLSFLVPKCDLFWSPHYNVPLFPIRARRRIVTIHDAYHLAFKDTLRWKERVYAEVMMRQAVSRSDAIITPSLFSQEELHRLLSVPKHLMRVIYPGVDCKRFSAKCSTDFKTALKQKYALPSSFYLFVGNVKFHKNLRLILDAYEQMSIDLPLVVAGKKQGLIHTDSSLHRIDCNSKFKEKIFVIGEVLDDELPALYQMATSLIFPSLYEGFGLPPLEAMAAGCPVIASHRASLPEACGDAAYFIYRNQPDELAEAMLKIARDTSLRSLLQKKGKKQAQRFSWAETARQYRALFEEIHSS